jgi:hypothetical protein
MSLLDCPDQNPKRQLGIRRPLAHASGSHPMPQSQAIPARFLSKDLSLHRTRNPEPTQSPGPQLSVSSHPCSTCVLDRAPRGMGHRRVPEAPRATSAVTCRPLLPVSGVCSARTRLTPGYRFIARNRAGWTWTPRTISCRPTNTCYWRGVAIATT